MPPKVKINIDKGFQGEVYDLIGVYCKVNKNDKRLKEVFTNESLQKGIELHYPSPGLCTDNAAMVACLASFRFEAGLKDDLNLEAYPNLI